MGALLLGAVVATGGGVDVDDGVWRNRIADSKAAARQGQYDLAWQRMGWTTGPRPAARTDSRCTAHASGRVRDFLTRTRCRSLRRVVLSVVDERRATAMVSIAWVQMPDVRSATRLAELAGAEGPDTVLPVGRELLEATGVWFTGKHRKVRRARSLVVIAEAARGPGRPDTKMLDAAAEIAVEYPPPGASPPRG